MITQQTHVTATTNITNPIAWGIVRNELIRAAARQVEISRTKPSERPHLFDDYHDAYELLSAMADAIEQHLPPDQQV